MVDADEETALLSAARDAAGPEDPRTPRRHGRVIAFVLVLVGALALVAAAGRGAADSETHKVANLHGFLNGFVGGGAGTSAPVSREPYGPVYLNPGDYGETRQITPLNGPPAPDYYHKGPRAPKYNQNSANSAGSIKYQSVTSFFAKIFICGSTKNPCTNPGDGMDLSNDKGFGTPAQVQAENEVNGQYYSQ